MRIFNHDYKLEKTLEAAFPNPYEFRRVSCGGLAGVSRTIVWVKY